MSLDPELKARVAAITGADLDRADTVTLDDVAIARAIEEFGLDSPAMLDAPIAIYTLDLLGCVRSWNRAAEALFGWTSDEAIGGPAPFVRVDDVAHSLDDLEQLVQGIELEGVEFSPTHRDGHELHVLASATLLRDENGSPGRSSCSQLT